MDRPVKARVSLHGPDGLIHLPGAVNGVYEAVEYSWGFSQKLQFTTATGDRFTIAQGMLAIVIQEPPETK